MVYSRVVKDGVPSLFKIYSGGEFGFSFKEKVSIFLTLIYFIYKIAENLKNIFFP